MNFYAWDEISNELEQRDPREMFERNAEGGWTTESWAANGRVEIRSQGRHIALECWAVSKEAAHELFLQVDTYRDYQEEAKE